LAAHDEAVRQLVAAARGREVTTTGDGFLVVFDGPALAIRTAMGRTSVESRSTRPQRIMGAASSGEILVSSITKALAIGSGYAFTERGKHKLRGFSGPLELFAVDAG
jgi:class 3 adenylate cyclase